MIYPLVNLKKVSIFAARFGEKNYIKIYNNEENIPTL